MTATHTYALMEVPPSVFELIKAQLLAAGYEHAICMQDGERTMLDMDGIAIVAEDLDDSERAIILTDRGIE